MTRLEVFVPKTLTWKPGQHCFLRIPSLSLLDNHPFTIASSSTAASESEKFEGGNLMVFLIRPHRGFTRRLAKYTHANIDVSFGVFIDGPYGGLPRRVENAFDGVILVAGGGGITASISWLEHLVRRMKSHAVAIRTIKLVWVVRKTAHLRWVKEELRKISDLAPKESLSMEFYVTDETEASVRAGKQGAHSEDLPETSLVRPNLGHVIDKSLSAPRSCVLGCGPESMKIDLSNAVARAQVRVIKGELTEVALYTETFGW
ncbi:MAG: hypothetical protein Q9167_001425 [Letrouitia subvulpina]